MWKLSLFVYWPNSLLANPTWGGKGENHFTKDVLHDITKMSINIPVDIATRIKDNLLDTPIMSDSIAGASK